LAVGQCGGSPGSFVAAMFVPFTVPEQPVIACALAKLSLPGAGGGGGGGPVGHPMSFNKERVRSCGGLTLCERLGVMFGSISWLGAASLSQCDTEEPSSCGLGANIQGCPCA